MNNQTEALLIEALARMDRARDILTDGKPTPVCNWGMLATEDLRTALSSQPPAPREPETPAQDAEELERMRASNEWHNFKDVVPILKAAQAGEWHWYENTRCKYIELRIDMRDLGCLVKDRERNRITPAMLAYQFSQSDADRASLTGTASTQEQT